MKQMIYGMLALLLASGCAKPYAGFVLNGKITGMDSGKIYLSYTDSLGQDIRDSAVVAGGKFTFRGGINEPTNAYVTNALDIRSMDDKGFTTLWIEPTEMTIEFPADNLKDFVLTGSLTNDEEQVLNKQKEPIRKEMEPLLAAYQSEQDHEKAAAIRDQFEPYNERMDEIDEAFLKSHPDSYLSPWMMRFKVSSLSVDEAQAYYDSWSDRVKGSGLAKEVAEEIQKLRNGSPGSPAAMFAKTDINGEMFNMADLKGQKYILLDFWASWCVPCRKSNPHLKELYKRYKDKGFEVVCVADDDRDNDKWKAAVEKDGIEEFKHVLRGLEWTDKGPDRSNDISEMYGIHSLPTKILIDKDGIIIGRYGGGGGTQEDMDQKLKEVFGV